MSFSWKVFFSTIIMMLITFSIGGYLLIEALFESTYGQEVNSAKEENKMLQVALATALSTISQGESKIEDSVISGIADSVINRINGEHILVRISNQDYGVIYQSDGIPFQNQLLKRIDSQTRGYMLLTDQGGYYLETACMIGVANQSIYLESFRNITSIYEERRKQYRIYQRLLIGLIVVNGLISYFISLWITYPIKKVSRVAHKISRGNIHDRVRTHSQDEIGKLAQDFNRMTDSLENKIHELEDMARRQEDFIGSFAHELKTPLTSIIGYADILRSNRISPELTVMSANYIFSEGIRLEALSLKLLELIVMRKQELELKRVYIRKLFMDVKGLIYPVLEKENITLKLEADNSCLYLEPDLIKTVLINLIDNGKKAIDGSGTIALTGRRENGGYGIYVKDTGKGIPREELLKIKEAFYMVDKSRAREQGGAGLGLAICDEIVKRHNAEMTFYSELGRGTTVHLFFREGVAV